jgi:hypothetical protein
MTDVEQGLLDLIDHLEGSWPAALLADLREEVEQHGEYGDALENLLALALQHGLDVSLRDAAAKLAGKMNLDVSLQLAELQRRRGREQVRGVG